VKLALVLLTAALSLREAGAAPFCTTHFPTVDQSNLWREHPCHCFDKMPRGTKIYLIDQYEVAEGDRTYMLPPETTFSCDDTGLTYQFAGETQRVAATATVTYVRAAAEMVVTSHDARLELERRLEAGTAIFERLR
jgi:hypothetical protein